MKCVKGLNVSRGWGVIFLYPCINTLTTPLREGSGGGWRERGREYLGYEECTDYINMTTVLTRCHSSFITNPEINCIGLSTYNKGKC